MKVTKTQLKQIIKEELNEALHPDQIGALASILGDEPESSYRAPETRLSAQMGQSGESIAEQEAEELQQILGLDWVVNVRMLEDRHELTVHKAYTDEEEEREIERDLMRAPGER